MNPTQGDSNPYALHSRSRTVDQSQSARQPLPGSSPSKRRIARIINALQTPIRPTWRATAIPVRSYQEPARRAYRLNLARLKAIRARVKPARSMASRNRRPSSRNIGDYRPSMAIVANHAPRRFLALPERRCRLARYAHTAPVASSPTALAAAQAPGAFGIFRSRPGRQAKRPSNACRGSERRSGVA